MQEVTLAVDVLHAAQRHLASLRSAMVVQALAAARGLDAKNVRPCGNGSADRLPGRVVEPARRKPPRPFLCGARQFAPRMALGYTN